MPLSVPAATRKHYRDDMEAPDPPAAPVGRLLLLSGYLLAFDACYLLATSRWGSYVGVPHHSIYIGDILFGASLVCWVLGGGIVRLWHVGRRLPIVWVSLLLIAWTAIRLASGSAFSQVALRDAAPYLYMLAVPVALTAPVSRRLVAWLAAAALVIHAAWLAFAMRDPSAVTHLPRLGPLRVLSTRTDFDMAVMGIAIGVGIVTTVRASSWWLRLGSLTLTAAATWNISAMNNRGGLLAAGASVVVVAAAFVWEALTGVAPGRQRARTVVTALLLCSATGIGFVQSPALGRLHGTFISPSSQPLSAPATSPTGSPSPTGRVHPTETTPSRTRPSPSASRPSTSRKPPVVVSPGAADASGTTQARETAWKDVYNYTTATTTRSILGVGFGPNFLQASGGLKVLSGGLPGLRAPHNILLNTWARLGAIGLALQIALILLGVWSAALAVRRLSLASITPWVLVAVAIPCVAIVGVILEAPFGALPYAFAIGLLARAAQRQGTVASSRAVSALPLNQV